MAAAGGAGAASGGGGGGGGGGAVAGVTAPPAKLKVIGAGTGGLDEMREKVNDGTVQFALCRFAFGRGTFKRNKLIFMTINGENASAVKKGRLLTKKGSVKTSVGSTSAEIQIEKKSDCTVDVVIDAMRRVMVMDDMGDFSIAQMKADYEAMIAAAAAGGSGGDVLKKLGGRKTAAELGGVDVARALEAVRAPMGHFNWMLMRPGRVPEFFNAGSLSVDEMNKWLKDDEVLFGLLRMGFGAGIFRRVKWICIHWSGDKVTPVKRGQANALSKDMMKLLEPFSLTIHTSSHDDLALEAIIDRVRRAAVVDGKETDLAANPYSVDEFLKALREEAAAAADFYGDAAVFAGGAAAEGEYDFAPTLTDVRDEKGEKNWALMEFEA